MIMEYIDEVQPTINAIKKLNLNNIAEKAKEDVEVVVIPGLSKGIEKTDNKLTVDFFGLKNTENGLVISGESLEAVLKNIFEV